MKKWTILFWVTTGLLFIFQGVLPILTTNTPETREVMIHYGYPWFFATMLAVFKLLGGLALILPFVPARLKEWAYAGFTFDFIAAFVTLWIVDGVKGTTFFPIAMLVLLAVSYFSWHRMKK